MTHVRLMRLSKRWFTLLRRLYPADFRDEMGTAVVEAYMDRARDAMKRGGPARLVALWIRALVDSCRNGIADHTSPGGSAHSGRARALGTDRRGFLRGDRSLSRGSG